MRGRVVDWATGVFAVCHRLLPKRYRVRYGSESVTLFRDLAEEAWRTRGVRGVLGACIRAVGDLVRQAHQPGGGPHRPRPEGFRVRRLPFIETLAQDIRYGLRGMIRQPGFSAAVIATLTLGIGATTATYSVVYGVLLRQLPFHDADRIYHVSSQYRGDRRDETMSYPDYEDLLSNQPHFPQATAQRVWEANLTGEGDAERLSGLEVTSAYFALWGMSPTLGRLLTADDDRYGSEPVVVLSHSLWQRRFGADPGVLGRSIRLDQTSYRVVGVGPSQFTDGIPGMGNPMMWRTMRFTGAPADSVPNRGLHTYIAFVRLADGVAMEQAEGRLRIESERLEALYPGSNLGMRAELDPLRMYWVGDRRPLLVFMGAVAFVLLIAVGNVTNLVVGRTTDRARELAVRTALGAGRSRIARQLVVEVGLLSVFGGGLGLLAAIGMTRLMIARSAGNLPLTANVVVDGVVMLVAAVSVVGTALAAGLAAGHLATRRGIGETLQAGPGGRAGTGRSSILVRNVLVTGEVTLSILLLIGAGLLVRSFWKLTRVDPGVNTHVATFRIAPSFNDRAAGDAFYRQLFERIRAIPGVGGVATVFPGLPFSGRQACGTLAAEDDPDRFAGQDMCAEVRGVTDDYFAVMGIPILRGRGFGPGEDADSPGVVLISESTANLLWPGQDPLGKRLRTGFGSLRHEVVGVVADVKQFALDEEPPPQTYVPEEHWPRFSRFVVVRATTRPEVLLPSLRTVVAELDPNLPVTQLGTVGELVAGTLTTERFYLLLLGAFAAVALSLAVVGIYGVVSYAVQQRRREVAIRMSLGAHAPRVMRLMVAQGLRPVGIGVGAGVVGAYGLTRLLQGLLFDVTATDPWTFVGVVILMTVVAASAVYLPARRAARLDPVAILRHD